MHNKRRKKPHLSYSPKAGKQSAPAGPVLQPVYSFIASLFLEQSGEIERANHGVERLK